MSQKSTNRSSSPSLPNAVVSELIRRIGPIRSSVGWTNDGLSQADLWKIESDQGEFAVKAHSPSLSYHRLEETHRFRRMLAGNGLEFISVPSEWTDRSTALHHSGRIWEWMIWLPGTPIAIDHAAHENSLENAIEAIAQMHRASSRSESNSAPSSGIEERVSRLERARKWCNDWRQGQWNSPILNCEPYASLIDLGCRKSEYWRDRLQPWQYQSMPSIWIHRDLRREHLFLHEQSVTGVIDFDAARVEWPIFDLVRYLGSIIALSDHARWQLCLRHYFDALGAHHELSLFQKLLNVLPDLVAASNWLSAFFWIERLTTHPEFVPTPAIHRRLRQLWVQLSVGSDRFEE